MPLSRLLYLSAAAALSAGAAAAQSSSYRDTLEAPGPQYDAGGLHQLLLGSEYRSLWITPVSVPFLELEKFAGGLRAVSQGGGQQTKSLLLVGRDGREFFFRSVDKDPSATLPAELRGTVAGFASAQHAGDDADVLQAAVVLGSGSASFEMLRYLTERLPVMVTPRWVGTLTQPIAIACRNGANGEAETSPECW